ncbi:monovalent cation:proton antiporter-2 (CPA2) family protein [Pseudomonas stutzeri]|uniref:monovalent cation:proton antiporter-2 (CPA2) family protein n=1 Tax=Pseudomonadaceae TaxID=135621 RepID=UPI00040CB6B4|nr:MULTISPECIES: monovalent cation:proton antiporter-2 (CPA2) family protein [Pseudomonadaceae]MBG0841249.1 cation:proton antiporter [Pseudomonas toyotomiensis]MCF0017409.1 monovalent cation:proton antiporter-2 (CPA2) family protein [Stutzerimonas stutzeri]MCF0018310.1 monovalent cation:proton antiporter-2 (CPA2) family protein [Stutzerimonas stutzeri]MDH0103617.1 monovalent cation:proton antiporter-2 (CPA2) family protein [Stutzerimonas stutzeri]MDH1587372.1 monovalent cation:proton antiporte
MAAEGNAGQLLGVITLLAAAVVAVPLLKRIGFGSVLGYLVAGMMIGPFGLQLIHDPHTIIQVGELGVVMFLFVIGLELKPSHLWELRGQIFGLGSLQVVVCAFLLTFVGMAFGFPWQVSFVCAAGFVLTSTALVMQVLSERGDITEPRGQRIVSILLFEDLLIVPLLAVVAFLAPTEVVHEPTSPLWQRIGIAALSLGALAAIGLWLLNPLFRVLAQARAREVMTAAALLVVLGAALLMEIGGLSMAMGAFVAGVLLSESTFRHQLEADIEPFRGLLLGLFFLGVGMALDLQVVATNWMLISSGLLALMLVKALCIYGVARLAKSPHGDALDRAVLMAQGGEFAFVLFAEALKLRVISPEVNANMTAIVVLSMAITPVALLLYRRLARAQSVSMDGVEPAHNLQGNVLIIGFGRVGQIACQAPLAQGAKLSIIEIDPEVIRAVEPYGFKAYYGDGARHEILHAAGAHHARAIIVCVNDKKAATRIVESTRHYCPQVKLLVRAFDREHALELVKHDADYIVRETFESALLLGRQAVLTLGASEHEADAVTEEVRMRDAERFALETAGGLFAGRALVLGNIEHIEPPNQEARDTQ